MGSDASVTRISEKTIDDLLSWLDGDTPEGPTRETYELISALRELRAYRKEGWRPIETAPKDGTEILVCGPACSGFYFSVACWKDRWQESWWSDYEDEELFPPSHWMPLPAAPEPQEET